MWDFIQDNQRVKFTQLDNMYGLVVDGKKSDIVVKRCPETALWHAQQLSSEIEEWGGSVIGAAAALLVRLASCSPTK